MAYLALLRSSSLPVRVNPDIVEIGCGPSYSFAVQFLEPPSLHLVAHHRNFYRPPPCVLVESGDRKKEILVRVEGVIFGGCAQKGSVGRVYRGREQVRGNGKAEI